MKATYKHVVMVITSPRAGQVEGYLNSNAPGAFILKSVWIPGADGTHELMN